MICGSVSGTRWRCSVALGFLLLSADSSAAIDDNPQTAAQTLFIQVETPSIWKPVLASVGLRPTVEPRRFRIVVGDSAAAREIGVKSSGASVRVAGVVEQRDPSLEIIWEKPLELPVYELPPEAIVFAHEKKTGAPVLAGFQHTEGATLWAAVEPGTRGYERFPYLPQALIDLGATPLMRGSRLWSFFDYSYRSRADVDYMARRWREAGMAALHVSAWHFQEPDPERARYLEKLISACHQQGVLVYAWLELPHVSEKFWHENPVCREKTAALQDAHLDWRKLVNLADPGCFDHAWDGIKRLLTNFDWDGVNVAEMYFESLHGPSNPQRFTPMNDWVRRDFEKREGIDPVALFTPESLLYWNVNEALWSKFADYRADLALDLQRRLFELIRATTPELDLVVTQIDDRFDTRMREYLGADAGALLSVAEQYDFTLAVEDPATLWNLGPDRYSEIARRYEPLVADPKRLAVDINIVERYQQTYPTKKQVGTELLQLVRTAGEAFSRVLLYFEHSLSRPDWALLPFAAAHAEAEWSGSALRVRAKQPVGVAWRDPVDLDGRPWPVRDETNVWLPAGQHTLTVGKETSPIRLIYLNGDLLDARSLRDGLTFEYTSRSRAIALLDQRPGLVEVDGSLVDLPAVEASPYWALRLPRGRHLVRIGVGGLIP